MCLLTHFLHPPMRAECGFFYERNVNSIEDYPGMVLAFVLLVAQGIYGKSLQKIYDRLQCLFIIFCQHLLYLGEILIFFLAISTRSSTPQEKKSCDNKIIKQKWKGWKEWNTISDGGYIREEIFFRRGNKKVMIEKYNNSIITERGGDIKEMNAY